MTALKDIPANKFPLTTARYRELKAEIITAAEAFEDLDQHAVASSIYKVADALDAAMNRIIEAEAAGL